MIQVLALKSNKPLLCPFIFYSNFLPIYFFMKWIIFYLLANVSLITFSLPTTLSPGDLAIIGFNFKNPDEFSFITFKDLEEGTIIYFTDCGWQSDGIFRKGEGLITYTVPFGGIKAYQAVTYPTDPGFVTQGISGFFGLATNGDQLLAFQGSFDLPAFLFALTTYNNQWQGNAIDNNTTSLPSELSSNHAYISFDLSVNGSYQCDPTIHLIQSITLNSIINPNNWITSDNRVNLPGTCFNIDLPITILRFEFKKLEEEMQAWITIFTDGITEVNLQGSGDGLEFKNIESRYVRIGTSTITFNTSLRDLYYRVMLIENQHTIYSTILRNPYYTKDTVISTMVYSLQGQILELSEGSINLEPNYLKNKFGQTVLIKEIDSAGKIIITKYFLEP
jgi:hypothetical protein